MNSLRRTSRVAVVMLVTALAFGLSLPAAGANAGVDEVKGPFVSVVPVAYADNPAGVELMFVQCDFVRRVVNPDGSAKETQHCHLTEPFVVFPGTPPDRAFNNRAGECIWFSDYFLLTTGDDVLADSVRVTVSPSGVVNVTTTYPATPLDC